ncbi:MAG: DUF4386 domain-containing protein [Anaerolineales bacterium]|nr:MAG: DUF4386 domain-containing protein [Anaerolineales bacterium]
MDWGVNHSVGYLKLPGILKKGAPNSQKGENAMTTQETVKKTARTAKTSPLFYARLAGILYLLEFPLGLFGMMYVPSTLIVPGDAATTANNIMTSGSLFRLSIVSALILQIINILLVLVLYKLLKPVSKNSALLMVVFFLVSAPIAMLNQLNQFAALPLVSGADYLRVFTPDQLQALLPLFLDLHEHGINIAGIFWGLWLFPMGYSVFKSGFLPRILGVLLVIGCLGYLIDSFAFFLFPDYGVEIAMFTGWGELIFPLWLVIKGVNVEKWEKRALEAA